MDNKQLQLGAQLFGITATAIGRIDANQDGKRTGQEVGLAVLGLASQLYALVPQIDVPAFIAEARASDSEARRQALKTLKMTFDIADDELEDLLEDTLDEIEDTYTVARERIDAWVGIVKRYDFTGK